MSTANEVLLFAKEKWGIDRIIKYLRKYFEKVEVFIGNVSDPFPHEALAAKPDICISYISPWIIPERILNQSKVFAINFHPGPPEYPGIGCTNFAVYEGAKQFGVTSHVMEPRVDTGKIISVKRFSITDEDTVYSLTHKSYRFLQEIFCEVMDYYRNQQRLPECDEKWSRRPFTRKELNDLCKLRLDMPQDEIRRRIKATTYPGMPGAYVIVDGRKIECPHYCNYERICCAKRNVSLD